MVTKDLIRKGLMELGLKEGDHVMVHSSLKSFGYVDGGADAVIDAILETVGPCGTMLVPSSVFGGSVTLYLRGVTEVDLRTAPSTLGKITETVRLRENSVRSIHPSHPVAAIGGKAVELLCEHHLGDSPVGEKSPYGKLALLDNGKILLLGVTTRSNTMLHTAEEYHAPYIFNGEVFNVDVISSLGMRQRVSVKGYCVDVERNFPVLDDCLLQEGIMRKGLIGGSAVILIDAKRMMETAGNKLRKNPYLLLKNPAIVPDNDLSGYLKTEKWLDAWYTLSNENITAILDSTRPRLLYLFAHGEYGTMQQLFYETDSMQRVSGMMGLVPMYGKSNNIMRPFPFPAERRPVANQGYKGVFDRDNRLVGLQGIIMYKGEEPVEQTMDFTARLEDDTVEISAKWPDGPGPTHFRFGLYPLYTHYRAKYGEWFDIEYYSCGFRSDYDPFFEQSMGTVLELKDSYGRVPGIEITIPNGSICLSTGCDRERYNAFYCNITATGHGDMKIIRLKLVKNPLTISGLPIWDRSGNNRLTMYGTAAEIAVDGKDTGIAVKGKITELTVNSKEARPKVTAVNGDSRTQRTFATYENPEEMLVRMADAVAKIPFKTGPVRNIIPYSYKLDSLEGMPRAGSAYVSHNLRVFPMLASGTLLTGNRYYADRALECLAAIEAMFYRSPDGCPVMSHEYDMYGKPVYVHSMRPSDYGLMVRSLLYTAWSCSSIKDEATACELILKGAGYARTCEKLQQPDGSFYARYTYPTLEPATKTKGTVNNWAIQMWKLARELDAIKPEEALRIRSWVKKFLEYWIKDRDGGLQVITGGDEDAPNFSSALATGATYFTIMHEITGNNVYRDYAEQALKMAIFQGQFRIDKPAYYAYAYYNCDGMDFWFNVPKGIENMGGMEDKTLVDAALYLYDELGLQIGLDAAGYIFADRLAEAVMPNGAVKGFIANAPNVYIVKNDFAQVLDYGIMGIYGFHWARKKVRR